MKQVFEIAPPSTAAVVTVSVIGVFFLALFLLLASSWRVRFEVSPQGLKIAGSIYGRTVPLSLLDLDRAKVIDLAGDDQHSLSRRTNGIGLPGFSSGWFRLNNGEKALAFVTDKKVAYVPTTDGYAVILSAKSPQMLLDSLWAASQSRGRSR